jgi:hypothetical protein
VQVRWTSGTLPVDMGATGRILVIAAVSSWQMADAEPLPTAP